jgi:DNA-directed RNA polymerase subunit beta
MVGVRLDRKRKQNVTVLLKALGWTNEQIREEFGQYESMMLTLEKDNTQGEDDALLDIYRKLRPGEPPTRRGCADAAEQLLLQPEALRPGQGRPLQDQQEARHRHARFDQQTP